MKILFVGDIVGKPGRAIFARTIPVLRREGRVDFVVANAENSAAGRGPTPEIARALLESGADVLTLGDHAWDAREMVAGIDMEERIVRPENFSKGAPGRGWLRVETPEGPLTVVQLIGRTFMPAEYDSPFAAIDRLLSGPLARDAAIVVDFHGEASSERMAMGRYLDGRVGALVGTHTHCQTSDETIFPGGTAYVTDLGMTGPKDSVLGREVEPVLKRFLTGVPHKFEVAKRDVALEGLVVDLDLRSGKARSVERVRERQDSSSGASEG